MDFYSSISLSGSGFRIWIRIQSGNLNPDPTGSGSETLALIAYTMTFLMFQPPGALLRRWNSRERYPPAREPSGESMSFHCDAMIGIDEGKAVLLIR